MALSRSSQWVASHAPARTIGAHHAYLTRIRADAMPPIISTIPFAMKSIEIDSDGQIGGEGWIFEVSHPGWAHAGLRQPVVEPGGSAIPEVGADRLVDGAEH